MASNRNPDGAQSAHPSLDQPGRSRRHLLAACTTIAMMGSGCAPAAFAGADLVRVDILDRDSGAPLHVYRDHGRPVVAGRPGARYAVRLVNCSGERVMAVVAIDGVNIVTGETASVDQRGYVLDPYQRASLTGWRKSDREVAVFEFTALADSYAARTGRPFDVGVIGVAVFRERLRTLEAANPATAPSGRAEGAMKSAPAPATSAAPAQPESSMRDDNAGSALRRADEARPQAPAAGERLGTGHGPRETSVVRLTTFTRATPQPEQRIDIRYDSLDNLVAAGIAPPPPLAATGPHAFPADPSRDYVPDPPTR